MLLVWDENAWQDYLWWQEQDRRTLKQVGVIEHRQLSDLEAEFGGKLGHHRTDGIAQVTPGLADDHQFRAGRVHRTARFAPGHPKKAERRRASSE